MKGSHWWAREVPEELGDGYKRAVLKAILDGHAVLEWKTITRGDLTFEIMRAPLAIGCFDDFVYVFGVSAELMDLIALELGGVMSCTPFLWDLGAEDPSQKQIGPFIQPNGAVGMTKTSAKRHNDAVQAALPSPCAFVSGCCKTYVLRRWKKHTAIRKGYACEYGWRAPSRPASWSLNASRTGRVIQTPQWAHDYNGFWDYSMGVIFVKAAATFEGRSVDLRDLAVARDDSNHVSLYGPVPFVIHPECPKPLDGDTATAPTSVDFDTELPALRHNDRGPYVTQWQQVLIDAGFSLEPYGADGHFGKLTREMTLRYQRSRGLLADGVVGAKTWATAGDGLSVPVPELTSLVPPFPPLVGTRDRERVFGAFSYEHTPSKGDPEAITIEGAWIRDNITQVKIPQLIGIAGAPRDGGVYFHAAVAKQLSGLFKAWEAEGLIGRIKSWAGSWVPRYIRGSRSVLSNHAFGSAFDINAPWNQLGATPAHVGATGSVRELVPIAHEFGFYWGGNFKRRPDGMHFEVAKIL